MARTSDRQTPVTISEVPPVGAPAEVNKIRDQYASQVEVYILAAAANVVLGAVSAGARTTFWFYHQKLAKWGPIVTFWHPLGWTIVDGDFLPDVLRMPRDAQAFHIEVVGGTNVGNATAVAQPVRGGV